jgi:superfamily I DNA/RNA helicase
MSPQQQAVVDWVNDGEGSAFVEAVAGSGKTTVLIEAAKHMRGSVAFTAFNKKIADEIKRKMAGVGGVRVATFHSFGFGAWRRVANQSIRVDQYEKWKRMMEYIDAPDNLKSAIGRMVSIAKQGVHGLLWHGEPDHWRSLIDHYDILTRVEENGADMEDIEAAMIRYAEDGLAWSQRVGKDLIDFDDMIWLPLIENAPVYTNDWVLVDEAQDTNPARRLLAERMLAPNGRMLWVGDRHQAIYGFTGADSDAVDQIIEHFRCIQLPLTVTFRCCKKATKFAQQWVPHIEAHEDNAEGVVARVDRRVFNAVHVSAGYSGREEPIKGLIPNVDTRVHSALRPGDAILCRLNRPLVSLAFTLIRNGIPAHVEGRDIGKSLDRLASKWKVESAAALAKNLEAYRARETEKFMARDAPHLIEPLNDRVDTLFVIMEGCETVREVRDKIDRLFQDTNGGARRTVTLSSVHKAKGREWDRVFILGFGTYMPSKMARQKWEKVQEANLMYVAATRTKDTLILLAAMED